MGERATDVSIATRLRQSRFPAPCDPGHNRVALENGWVTMTQGCNSLVTWNVSGSLATSAGAVLLVSESSLAVSITAPGIYVDAYAANGTPQSIPALDGSHFQYVPANVYAPIALYFTDNAVGSGNDGFGLICPLLAHTGPGTQSAVIPVDFSVFNPGTYQSEETGFDTVLTVNLTVEPVPEPSAPALSTTDILAINLSLKTSQIA
jgi:hypothetical protein